MEHKACSKHGSLQELTEDTLYVQRLEDITHIRKDFNCLHLNRNASQTH